MRSVLASRSRNWAVIVATSLLLRSLAQGSVVLEDHLNCTTGDLQGQGGWALNGGSGAQIRVINGNLSYSGLTAASGKMVEVPGSNPTDSSWNNFSSQASGTVYFSFILQVANLASTSVASPASGTTQAGKPFMQSASGGYQLGMARAASGATYVSTVFNTNEAVLLVIGCQFVNGSANDVVSLWLNPDSSSFGGTAPASSLSFNSGADPVASLDRFHSRVGLALAVFGFLLSARPVTKALRRLIKKWLWVHRTRSLPGTSRPPVQTAATHQRLPARSAQLVDSHRTFANGQQPHLVGL